MRRALRNAAFKRAAEIWRKAFPDGAGELHPTVRAVIDEHNQRIGVTEVQDRRSEDFSE